MWIACGRIHRSVAGKGSVPEAYLERQPYGGNLGGPSNCLFSSHTSIDILYLLDVINERGEENAPTSSSNSIVTQASLPNKGFAPVAPDTSMGKRQAVVIPSVADNNEIFPPLSPDNARCMLDICPPTKSLSAPSEKARLTRDHLMSRLQISQQQCERPRRCFSIPLDLLEYVKRANV